MLQKTPFATENTFFGDSTDEYPSQHYIGPIEFAPGLLITPTCDMEEEGADAPSHPFRTLVPVLPLSNVIEKVPGVGKDENLIRKRDTIGPYMYLPSYGNILPVESVACLFRPIVIHEELLRDPPQRLAQLQPPARAHLKYKLAFYWGRIDVNRADFNTEEKGEDTLRKNQAVPPSLYDPEPY